MRKIYMLGVLCLMAIAVKAVPTVSKEGNVLIITVNAPGDLASSNFDDEQRAATRGEADYGGRSEPQHFRCQGFPGSRLADASVQHDDRLGFE